MDLFVLHAPADAPFVHGYLLPELGLPEGSVRTPADFTPGASRAAELERAVTGARVVLLVLTPAFLDDTWSELGEQLASHAAVGAREGRLVPLVLQPCRLPLRVEFLVQLDCTSQDRWDDAVGRLRRHLDHPGPARPTTWPAGCPARAW